MPITEASVVNTVYARLVARGVDPATIKRPHLFALIPKGLKQLAIEIAASGSDEYKQLLQKEESLNLASGVADFSSKLDAGLLAGTIDRGQIYHSSNTNPLQDVGDRAMLQFAWPNTYIHYAIQNNKIYTRNVDGALDSLTGSLIITGIFIPTLSTLDPQLKQDLVDRIVHLVASGEDQ